MLVLCFRTSNTQVGIRKKMNILGFGRRNIGKWNFDHQKMEIQLLLQRFVHIFLIRIKVAFFHLSVWLSG